MRDEQETRFARARRYPSTMRAPLSFSILTAFAACAALGACSSGKGSSFGEGSDAGAGGGGDSGTLPDTGVDPDGGLVGDGATHDAGNKVGEVYAHSSSTLYKLEPFSKQVTVIGDFRACSGSIIDIALDKDGQMYGTTFSSLERIDKANASCVSIASGSYPNSLTFVPAGTLDANVEALVGFEGDQYVRIDLQNGRKSTVGSLNPNSLGHTFQSSGDVVSIIGDKTYLTVKASPSMGSDVLIEVDPKTGRAVKMIGATGQQDLFGVGYWAGTAYGFSNGGQIFAINLSNGTTTNIPIPNPPSGLSFWGAGVTTAAPILPPN